MMAGVGAGMREMLLEMGGGGYCRYEGERSQRHLEGSGLNGAMGVAVREKEGRREKLRGQERARRAGDQETA